MLHRHEGRELYRFLKGNEQDPDHTWTKAAMNDRAFLPRSPVFVKGFERIASIAAPGANRA
jgi:hypothetical protein